MSVYQGIIVLLVLFVICMIMSLEKKEQKTDRSKNYHWLYLCCVCRSFRAVQNEFSELDKCKQSYHGFYVSDSLCYNTTNVSHDYLEGHEINISAVMYLSEKTAEIITTDGRTIIVAKSPDGFSLFPQH